MGLDSQVHTGSAVTYSVHQVNEDMIETVPPAPAEKYPVVFGGEDKDPIMRERRNKVREVSVFLFFFSIFFLSFWNFNFTLSRSDDK